MLVILKLSAVYCSSLGNYAEFSLSLSMYSYVICKQTCAHVNPCVCGQCPAKWQLSVHYTVEHQTRAESTGGLS